jgi:hypothetical protein
VRLDRGGGAMSEEAQRALEAQVQAAWPAAQARWSRFLLLGEPVVGRGLSTVAQIHLGDRRITLDGPRLLRYGLEGAVEAILAHEIGHHVRYPGTLAAHARMRLMERALIPLKDYSLLNLFTDLLINEYLGRWYKEALASVYRAFHAEIVWARDPAFLFYMAVYEELWGLAPGSLVGPGWEAFSARYPGHRVDAQLLGQRLFALGPNVYVQLLYFLSVFSAYLAPFEGEEPERADPYACLEDSPSAEDWADALVPGAREREALRRAVAEGWIRAEDGERIGGGEGSLERRILSLPGQGSGDAALVPEVMAAWYRIQAEKYLLRPPPIPTLGEAVVPTTLERWEPGESSQEIDWTQTLLQHGPVLGAAAPLRRVRIAEIEGYEVPFWQPRVEIYLDVSGSMPDPRRSQNAMTLAAQILTLGATRAGGHARALLYSTEAVRYWAWCRSEVELSRFLMHYIGAGTRFPFGALQASVEECGGRQPARVIITDSDFFHNYQEDTVNARIFAEAASRSGPLVLLLNVPAQAEVSVYRSAGAQVVIVEAMEDFPRLAVGLARALFEGAEVGRGAL